MRSINRLTQLENRRSVAYEHASSEGGNVYNIVSGEAYENNRAPLPGGRCKTGCQRWGCRAGRSSSMQPPPRKVSRWSWHLSVCIFVAPIIFSNNFFFIFFTSNFTLCNYASNTYFSKMNKLKFFSK